MSVFTRKRHTEALTPPTNDQRIVSLTKAAAVSLQKNNLTGHKAAVYYDGILSEFPGWLAAAKLAGVLR